MVPSLSASVRVGPIPEPCGQLCVTLGREGCTAPRPWFVCFFGIQVPCWAFRKLKFSLLATDEQSFVHGKWASVFLLAPFSHARFLLAEVEIRLSLVGQCLHFFPRQGRVWADLEGGMKVLEPPGVGGVRHRVQDLATSLRRRRRQD